MGTTMHAHIEVKVNNKWLHFAAPNVDRDYTVFALINGCRKEDTVREIVPVAKIHEIPKDMSVITQLCLNKDQKAYTLHDFCTLYPDEIRVLQAGLRNLVPDKTKALDLEEDVFKTYINGNTIASHDGFDNSRIIIWYDN